MKTSVQEDIHCICRMPYNKATDMIQCSFCLVWFHSVCIDISNVKDYSDNKWFCLKCSAMQRLFFLKRMFLEVITSCLKQWETFSFYVELMFQLLEILNATKG